MCKSKRSTKATIPHRRSTPTRPRFAAASSSASSFGPPSYSSTTSSSNFYTQSFSSKTSLSTLRDSLPESPHIYNLSSLRDAATTDYGPSWRCTLRGKHAIVFRRKLRRSILLQDLSDKLSVICRSHHSSIIKLLGASISGNSIYLVYEFVDGANLADCLRNRNNPDFTVLSSWVSRMRIAADLAHGLDYIHNSSSVHAHFTHNRIKSTSVVITVDSLNAKICHFGTAELCGEVTENRPNSKKSMIEGTRGYMAPEFQISGVVTQKCDVYAFGVVILELLSGKEALRYEVNESTGEYWRLSVVDAAREAAAEGGGGVRRWVDGRLKDSYPVEVAENMVWLALECVHGEASKRPDMGRVAGRISKLYLDSTDWADKIGLPTDFSMSMAPR